MKKIVFLIAAAVIMFAYSPLLAQSDSTATPATPQHGIHFVDNNGDGYNDNAPDHDGDGIPNGLDPDYVGPKLQRGKFIDLNGDGINDNVVKRSRNGRMAKGGYGPANGSCLKIAPKDGTGNGAGAGTGNGNGNGSKGSNGRGNRGNGNK